MAKQKGPEQEQTVTEQIRRAAKASRSMTIPERGEIMIKAGLATTGEIKEGLIDYEKN